MHVMFSPDDLRELADFLEEFSNPAGFYTDNFATKNPLDLMWYNDKGNEYTVGQIMNEDGRVFVRFNL